jgi:hypothetical protein
MSHETNLHLNRSIYLTLLRQCYTQITYMFADLSQIPDSDEYLSRLDFVSKLYSEIIRVSDDIAKHEDKANGHTHQDPWTSLESGERPEDQEDVLVCNKVSKDDIVADKAFYDADSDSFMPYDTPDPLHKMNPTHFMRYKPNL